MRYQCKYCKTNFTGLILKQMEGKITRQDVLDYYCCETRKRKQNEENNN